MVNVNMLYCNRKCPRRRTFWLPQLCKTLKDRWLFCMNLGAGMKRGTRLTCTSTSKTAATHWFRKSGVHGKNQDRWGKKYYLKNPNNIYFIGWHSCRTSGGSIGLFADLSLITVVKFFVCAVKFFFYWYLKRRHRVQDRKHWNGVCGTILLKTSSKKLK